MKRFASPVFFVLMIVGIIGILQHENSGTDPKTGMHELRATVTAVNNEALVEMGNRPYWRAACHRYFAGRGGQGPRL